MPFSCHFLIMNAVIAHLSDAMKLHFLICSMYPIMYSRVKGNNKF